MSNMYIHEPRTDGKICLVTTLGDIDVELWPKECPLACRNFVQLCMEGYYDNTIFHRLQKDFMVQGGDPTGTGEANDSIYDEPFKTEFHQRLTFNRRGLLACAGGKDQCGSQFFFTLAATPDLHKKHTLFGKVTGNTIFNLMRFNEHDVDKNERPVPEQRIKKVKILQNPFPDIKPRSKKEEKREKKKDKERERDRKKVVKNTALLSFGDEAEEEEKQLFKINETLSNKGKSAHDVLKDDARLSKDVAVRPEELSSYRKEDDEERDEDEHEKRNKVSAVREKLKRRREEENATTTTTANDEDVDFDDAMASEKKRKIDDEKERLAAELRELQKEFAKSLRPAREQAEEDNEPKTKAMKNYSSMRLKFKSKTTGIVKQTDPTREEQTMRLLDLMKTRISRSSVNSVLSGHKVDMSDLPSTKQLIMATSDDQGKLDEAAEDLNATDWMQHKLVAPEDTSGVTKARDANLRENDEEWYPVGDPRNKMAQRRRDGVVD